MKANTKITNKTRGNFPLTHTPTHTNTHTHRTGQNTTQHIPSTCTNGKNRTKKMIKVFAFVISLFGLLFPETDDNSIIHYYHLVHIFWSMGIPSFVPFVDRRTVVECLVRMSFTERNGALCVECCRGRCFSWRSTQLAKRWCENGNNDLISGTIKV